MYFPVMTRSRNEQRNSWGTGKTNMTEGGDSEELRSEGLKGSCNAILQRARMARRLELQVSYPRSSRLQKQLQNAEKGKKNRVERDTLMQKPCARTGKEKRQLQKRQGLQNSCWNGEDQEI